MKEGLPRKYLLSIVICQYILSLGFHENCEFSFSVKIFRGRIGSSGNRYHLELSDVTVVKLIYIGCYQTDNVAGAPIW